MNGSRMKESHVMKGASLGKAEKPVHHHRSRWGEKLDDDGAVHALGRRTHLRELG
jgi:hypothetical protein